MGNVVTMRGAVCPACSAGPSEIVVRNLGLKALLAELLLVLIRPAVYAQLSGRNVRGQKRTITARALKLTMIASASNAAEAARVSRHPSSRIMDARVAMQGR